MSNRPLENVHAGEIAYIVGKGPSLRYLSQEHFGSGPVITINEAIVSVEKLKLDNPIYSLQKDGCRTIAPNNSNGLVTRGHTYPHKCGYPMVYPHKDTTLILCSNDGYSGMCLPSHKKRVLFDLPLHLGLVPNCNSLLAAFEIAVLMGCSSVVLLCFDSFNKDYRTYNPHNDEITNLDYNNRRYPKAIRRIKAQLVRLPHTVVIPQPNKENQHAR
jgi:hypothetical protein